MLFFRGVENFSFFTKIQILMKTIYFPLKIESNSPFLNNFEQHYLSEDKFHFGENCFHSKTKNCVYQNKILK